MDERNRRPASQWIFIATIVVVAFYAPLAINYTWPLFFPGMPRLQDGLNTLLNGPEYATGQGSVESVRHSAYTEHRVVLLIHTTLGALALTLAMFQFSVRLRVRHPAVHRWTGRGYLMLMTASMLTALLFLFVTPPAEHFIGRAFETQLRGLAVGTLGSAWYAVYAIRRRDVVSHRAWMTYSIAFMMTAPLLRLLWIGLQPLIPQHDVLTNIGAASLILGVAAPGAASMIFMLTRRDASAPTPPSVSAWVYAAIVLLAVIGSSVYTALTLRLRDPIPHTLVLYHLVPLAVVILITVIGIRNARARGNATREWQWRWILLGFAAAPVATTLYSLIVPPSFTAADAIIAGGMDGSVITITIALAIVVRAAAASDTNAAAEAQPTTTEHAPAA
ncbi:putative membrane protein [Mycobacterium sp. MAA66]|uniref:DUF2306 domain-containing protein n=1 Tax=Mycobacterium sp. MAA66 TaxID=3156297 RepID=UPI0035182A06